MWVESPNILFALVLRGETLQTQNFWQMVTQWPFLFYESLGPRRTRVTTRMDI